MRRALLASFFVLVTGCKPNPEDAKNALASPDPAVREKAATTLRAMYAKDPRSVGDHGEAYWTERLERARGKKTPEVVKILDGVTLRGGEGGGGGESVSARLDDFWMATLGRSTRGDDTVFAADKPRRFVQHVDAKMPSGFDGTWTTYYVNGAPYETFELRGGVPQRNREFHDNGRMRTEILYVDGKADGTFATRSADGKLEREHVYVKGKTVAERSFYPSGKVEHETIFGEHAIERSKSFEEDGSVKDCSIYDAGVPSPCPK
jgi:antitoxin component YwqK of YwqJK toxin-antitoxin module